MTKAWNDVPQRLNITIYVKLKAICAVANIDELGLLQERMRQLIHSYV
jgi:hypothetical protein